MSVFIVFHFMSVGLSRASPISGCLQCLQRLIMSNSSSANSSTVVPKVCSADHQWSARLAQVVRESQYKPIFLASRSTKIFLVVRAPEKFGNHCSSISTTFFQHSDSQNMIVCFILLTFSLSSTVF